VCSQMTKTVTQKARAKMGALKTARVAAKKKVKNQNRSGKSAIRGGPSGPRVSASVAVAQIRRQYWKMEGNRAKGCDLVDALSNLTTSQFGVVSSRLVNPTLFSGTKLENEANSWEKFKFTKLAFHWTPNCPTSTAGGLLMGFDTDPTDPDPQLNLNGLRTLMGHAGAVAFAPWESASAKLQVNKDDPFLFTGVLNGQALGATDERWSYQGQFYLIATQVLAAAAGMLWAEYEVEFENPQVAQSVSQNAQVNNTNNPPISTTTNLLNALNYSSSPVQTGDAFLNPVLQPVGGVSQYVYKLAEGVYDMYNTATQSGSPGSPSNLYFTQPFVQNLDPSQKPVVIKTLSTPGQANAIGDQFAARFGLLVPPGGAYMYPQLYNAAAATTVGLLQSVIKRLPTSFSSLL